MARPRIMLLDEPGAGMNDAETAELGTILRAIQRTGPTAAGDRRVPLLQHSWCDALEMPNRAGTGSVEGFGVVTGLQHPNP